MHLQIAESFTPVAVIVIIIGSVVLNDKAVSHKLLVQNYSFSAHIMLQYNFHTFAALFATGFFASCKRYKLMITNILTWFQF